MATLYGVLLAVLLLLATAHAQFDFCANGSTRHVRNDANVREVIETTFLAVGDVRIPRVADSEHDLVVGNCTGDIGEPNIVNDDCSEPNPFGIAMTGHGYLFMDKVIHCIKIVDRYEDGTGGYPSISTGGAGHMSVEIMFTSQEHVGLRFYTEVYAKYEPPTKNQA